jgi:hypothetical protein
MYGTFCTKKNNIFRAVQRYAWHGHMNNSLYDTIFKFKISKLCLVCEIREDTAKNIAILNVTYKFFITYLQTHRYATFITLQIPTVNLRLEEIHILFTALWYGIEWLATFRFDGNSGLSVDVLSCQNKEQGNNVLQLAILMPFPQYL